MGGPHARWAALQLRRLARKHGITGPPIEDLALIVRAADTDRLDLARQAAGLLAIPLGLSQCFRDDREQLCHGFVIYDALYAWLTKARGERHTWNPQRRPPAPAPG